MTKPSFAGMTAAQFLRRYWQKRPLHARDACTGPLDFLHRDRLFELACRDDVESRLVARNGRHWTVRHGPFTRRALSRIHDSSWTLLVQGVNLVVPEADALLQSFSFIPYSRLDDVMVSYAPP